MIRGIAHLCSLVLLLCCFASAPQVLAQHCGTERWPVKTGTDADVQHVELSNRRNATIADLIALTAPNPIPPDTRVAPTETTVFVVNAMLTDYKLEGGPHGDSDYHLVLQDEQGDTMVAEIPFPACVGDSSPFATQIASARAEFDSQLTAATFFQTANIPVQVTGVGFFDFFHNQHGVAPNAIELHPLLDIVFNPPIKGRIYEATSKRGISALTIRLIPPTASQKAEKITTTDENGEFQFTGVTNGTYLVEVYYGLTILHRSVIDTWKDKKIDVVLKKKGT